jgi:hypothetical protein
MAKNLQLSAFSCQPQLQRKKTEYRMKNQNIKPMTKEQKDISLAETQRTQRVKSIQL